MALKVGVYTVALNEEQFVNRWVESAKGADYLLVADTGSKDNTVENLRNTKLVDVQNIRIKPWRFDDARNASLHMLPSELDVAIQLDMDEILVPNWRDYLEAVWKPETNRLRYRYVWSWKEGKPDRTFFSDKIGGRNTHRWKNPVHEILTPTVPEVIAVCEQVLIEHHPDPTKSRAQYLPLLELSVKEDPYNDRNSHYLGREYYFYGKIEESIAEFKRHLALPTALWAEERCASMRYLAKCYEILGNRHETHQWYTKAALEDPMSREAMIDMAKFLLDDKDWYGVIHYCNKALRIPANGSSYINERYALQEGAYDLASVALWQIGDKDKAKAYAEIAVKLNPDDQRLVTNLLSMSK